MQGVIRIIEQLVLNSLISAATPVSTYKKAAHNFINFSIFLIFIGFVFSLYSLFLWLSLYHPLHVVVVVIGAVCACIGGIILGITYYFISKQKLNYIKISKNISSKVKDIVSDVDEEWGEIISKNPKISALISIFVGFLVEDNIIKYFKKEGR